MPRVNTGQTVPKPAPGAVKSLERIIADQYGMCLTMVNLLKVLGMKDYRSARLWLESEKIQAVEINGRSRWLATDVARALERSKFRT